MVGQNQIRRDVITIGVFVDAGKTRCAAAVIDAHVGLDARTGLICNVLCRQKHRAGLVHNGFGGIRQSGGVGFKAVIHEACTAFFIRQLTHGNIFGTVSQMLIGRQVQANFSALFNRCRTNLSGDFVAPAIAEIDPYAGKEFLCMASDWILYQCPREGIVWVAFGNNLHCVLIGNFDVYRRVTLRSCNHKAHPRPPVVIQCRERQIRQFSKEIRVLLWHVRGDVLGNGGDHFLGRIAPLLKPQLAFVRFMNLGHFVFQSFV